MHELLLLLPFVEEEEDRTLVMLAACYEVYILNARVPQPRVTLDSFTEEEFVDIFRFAKVGFGTVFTLFEFEDEVDVGNRYKVSGKECFLILLARLAYPGRLCQLARVFHRSKAALSTIFNHTLTYVHGRTQHLLTFDPQRLIGPYA